MAEYSKDKSTLLDVLVKSIDPSKKTTKEFKSRVKKMKKKVRQNKKEKPSYVTDHAIVRYVERVMGINTDVIRKGLSKYCDKEDGSYFLDSGINVIVIDGRVVTIADITKEHSKIPKKKDGNK
jgi:hypothetical protein